MDLTHLHLVLNHVPVIGLMIGFFVLVWGTIRKYDHVKNTGLLLLLVASIVTIPVYLTGEPAGEIVEKLPGVSEQIIGLHEDAAMFSLVLCIAVGGLAFLALIVRRFFSDAIGMIAIFAVLILTSLAGVSIAYTANLGGQVRHTEIRQSQVGTPQTESKTTDKKRERDDDDH